MIFPSSMYGLTPAGLSHRALYTDTGSLWFEVVRFIERQRPTSLRMFDQIPMHADDLLAQVKFMVPRWADKQIVFMGDHDSTSLLLGALGMVAKVSLPSKMLLLDFDQRLLDVAQKVAWRYGFDHLLECRLYNVFDPVPFDLMGQFDWFYTNPPYGCRNNGESARLFITRCLELSRPLNAHGGIILPDDNERDWTVDSMLATQKFLSRNNWAVDEKFNQQHRYWLDDDPGLKSSLVLVKSKNNLPQNVSWADYASRGVGLEEIPFFYGQSVEPPYPRYIRSDGTFDYNWDT